MITTSQGISNRIGGWMGLVFGGVLVGLLAASTVQAQWRRPAVMGRQSYGYQPVHQMATTQVHAVAAQQQQALLAQCARLLQQSQRTSSMGVVNARRPSRYGFTGLMRNPAAARTRGGPDVYRNGAMHAGQLSYYTVGQHPGHSSVGQHASQGRRTNYGPRNTNRPVQHGDAQHATETARANHTTARTNYCSHHGASQHAHASRSGSAQGANRAKDPCWQTRSGGQSEHSRQTVRRNRAAPKSAMSRSAFQTGTNSNRGTLTQGQPNNIATRTVSSSPSHEPLTSKQQLDARHLLAALVAVKLNQYSLQRQPSFTSQQSAWLRSSAARWGNNNLPSDEVWMADLQRQMPGLFNNGRLSQQSQIQNAMSDVRRTLGLQPGQSIIAASQDPAWLTSFYHANRTSPFSGLGGYNSSASDFSSAAQGLFGSVYGNAVDGTIGSSSSLDAVGVQPAYN